MRPSQSMSTRSGATYVASLMGRDDSRVVRALEEYLEAIESGQPPARNDFLVRHAAIAERLVGCLDGLDMLRTAVSGFATETHAPGAAKMGGSLAPGGHLGDYQILREVGRGGMGVVYEALQVSLGRRVALKVLPAALAIDPRQLQRFRVEARAAAQLHHSNIVPVFAVDCDQNVHYYAMQFIDGPTLAEVIQALRNADPSRQDASESGQESNSNLLRDELDAGPEKSSSAACSACDSTSSPTDVFSAVGEASRYRAVARLGIQAALALDHAHRLGVVHRDIKPANLMIDARGNLWITDFGLARIQEDNGLTITGDLLGTLRYMSPEQASGRRTVVDHRADIFALGTTLYELLTLKTAVGGRDRHELIRQITQDDPIRPRRVDVNVPRELETIVLKAMAKEPTDRYATANDLADDLQRFLDDKPIQAKAPTLLDRSAKFARRHRSVVRAACVLLFLASVFLGISTFHIAKRLDQVELQRRSATEMYWKARAGIDEMYTQMVENWLPIEPEKAQQQHQVLVRVLKHYQDFAQVEASDAAGLSERALAYRRIGDIQYRLGRFDEAEDAYRTGLSILDRLGASTASENVELASHASQLCQSLGRLLHATIRDAEAEDILRRAIAYQNRFMTDPQRGSNPEAQGFLAHLHLDLALIHQYGGHGDVAHYEFLEAARIARQAADSDDQEAAARELARALVASIESHLLQTRGDIDGTLAQANKATEILRGVLHANPTRLEARVSLAQAYFRQAWLLGVIVPPEKRDDATALELAAKAVALEPNNASYHNRHGGLLMSTGRYRDAERSFRTVLSLVPDSPDAHNSLAWILVTYANPADRKPKQAVELASRAVSKAPQVGLYWNTLGVAYYESGDWRKAVAALDRSIELRGGGDSFDWFYLAMSYWNMGRPKDARYWLGRATQWRANHRPFDLELARFQQVAQELILGEAETTAEMLAQKPKQSGHRSPETPKSVRSIVKPTEPARPVEAVLPAPPAAPLHGTQSVSRLTQSERGDPALGQNSFAADQANKARATTAPAPEPIEVRGGYSTFRPAAGRSNNFSKPVGPD